MRLEIGPYEDMGVYIDSWLTHALWWLYWSLIMNSPWLWRRGKMMQEPCQHQPSFSFEGLASFPPSIHYNTTEFSNAST